MGFFSFLGRVLFSSAFIISAWQIFNEFGEDGGPAAKGWAPKLALVEKHVNGIIGKDYLHVDARTFVATIIFFKAVGGLLFVIGSSFGAYLMIFYLVMTAPLLHDFYNYKVGDPKFFEKLHNFLQWMAFLGALLFFLGMRKSILRRQLKKKSQKAKAA